MPYAFGSAATTLNGAVAATDTSITVTSGAVFASYTPPYLVMISAETTNTNELVRVTARSTNTLTVQRSVDTSSPFAAASAHSSGAAVNIAIIPGPASPYGPAAGLVTADEKSALDNAGTALTAGNPVLGRVSKGLSFVADGTSGFVQGQLVVQVDGAETELLYWQLPGSLTMNVQPSDVAANAAITPSVKVNVLDQEGHTQTRSVNVVATLTVPGGATLGGTTTRASSAGLATFDDLTVDTTGTYTLTFTTATTVTVVSASFVVS